MKAKKLWALLMALAMVFSLAACGDTAEDTSDADNADAENTDTAEASDLAYVQDKGTLVVGITEFEPMDYQNESGEWVGFDADLAKEFAESLGVEAQFQIIDWDSKIMELQAQTIDCIWNGMTITPELQEALTISDPYIKNYQVVVIRSDNADVYTSTADLVGKTVEAEAGSAGEAAIIGEGADESLKQAEYISAAKQTDTLLEVKTGAADAAVLDFVLAGAMVGQGDYSDLMIIPDLQLSVEEYGVGFRKDSDAAEKVNEAMQALIEDGTLNTLAEKYDLAELLLANQ
mgnify:CR=1 FL=1